MGQTCRVIRYVTQASEPFRKPQFELAGDSRCRSREQVRVHHYGVLGDSPDMERAPLFVRSLAPTGGATTRETHVKPIQIPLFLVVVQSLTLNNYLRPWMIDRSSPTGPYRNSLDAAPGQPVMGSPAI